MLRAALPSRWQKGFCPNTSGCANWINEASSDPELLPIVSKRIDQTPGTHEVRYTSGVDEISIKHTAHSRVGFARGALLAARWVIGKKGFFGMKDVLGV